MSPNRCSLQVGFEGEDCGRAIVRDNRCIFHLEDKNDTETALFKREFLSYAERSLEDDHVAAVDCTKSIIPRIGMEENEQNGLFR